MATPVRPLSSVSTRIWFLLILSLASQLSWHHLSPQITARAVPLSPPPLESSLRLAALGEEPLVARLLMLWLQAADTQPGISVSLKDFDYQRVQGWLDVSLALDPKSQYPLLAATRIYAGVREPTRVRTMLNFIYEKFLQAPNLRWRWLAEASIVARHRLKDLELAKLYSLALTHNATSNQVPNWARDMSVLLLAQTGEFEAAVVLTAKLIKSGRITDPHEINFLQKQLDELQAEQDKSQN